MILFVCFCQGTGTFGCANKMSSCSRKLCVCARACMLHACVRACMCVCSVLPSCSHVVLSCMGSFLNCLALSVSPPSLSPSRLSLPLPLSLVLSTSLPLSPAPARMLSSILLWPVRRVPAYQDARKCGTAIASANGNTSKRTRNTANRGQKGLESRGGGCQDDALYPHAQVHTSVRMRGYRGRTSRRAFVCRTAFMCERRTKGVHVYVHPVREHG